VDAIAAEATPTASEARWTGAHVCHLFVMARLSIAGRSYLVMGGDPGRVEGVLSMGVGHTDQPMPPGALKVLHWLGRVDDPTEKAMLREYLRYKTGAAEGHSLANLIRGHGWTERQFNRTRERVCQRVADDLIRRGVPLFDLTSDGKVLPYTWRRQA
jgi:hypothetical protein